jgi:hypothetical protein
VPRNGEHGEIGLPLVIVMAFVAALAWIVPSVLLGNEEANNAATLIGVSDHQDSTKASSAAPEAPIDKANDVQGQALLTEGVRVAQMYFAEHGGYDGFTPQAASGYEPAVTFTSGPATTNAVSIRGVTPTTVVLVTATGRGTLCAAAESSTVTFGRSDAQAPAQCTGGW